MIHQNLVLNIIESFIINSTSTHQKTKNNCQYYPISYKNLITSFKEIYTLLRFIYYKLLLEIFVLTLSGMLNTEALHIFQL